VLPGGPFGALLVLAAGLLILVSAARAAGPQVLYASFNADGSMRLSLGDGSSAGVIPPGPYTVIVNNNTPDDNFGPTHDVHLFGPGVDYSSVLTQEEETQAVWTVTFQPNSAYTFQDDYRPALIHIAFRTSAAGTASSGSTSVTGPAPTTGKSVTTNTDVAGSAVLPARGVLRGTVTASGALSLAYKGQAVTRLKPGKYKVTVEDESSKNGFRVQRLHARPIQITDPVFVGTRSVNIALTTGQWWYFPLGGKRSGFIVAS